MSVEAKLAELGHVLPSPMAPTANFRACARMGNYIFTSGHVSEEHDGTFIVGKIGKELSVEQGYRAAQHIALSLLATLKAELGSLDHVKRIVKLTGFVNCTSDFTNQSGVMNGATELLVAVLGDNGRPARSALGMNALPFNVAVEIEAVVEVDPSVGAKSAL